MSFNLLCHCLHQLDLQILWVRSSYLWLIDISVLFGLHCLIMVSWRQSLPSHTSKYSTTGNWEESRLITADLGVYEASVQMWSGPVLKQQQSLGVGVTQLTSILHETYTEILGVEIQSWSWLKKPRLVWDWVSRRCDTKLTFISLSTARGHSNNTKQTSLARRVGTN